MIDRDTEIPGESSRPGYTVDEIRERIDIVEVISGFMALKKAGKRFKGLCPFHPDQNPSLTVDPDKGLWHCFGCKEGGNVFHFLMKVENLTFLEAARKLARRAGLPLKELGRDSARASESQVLIRINRAAGRFFRDRLGAPEGEAAQAYLRERGISPPTAGKFGLGYAPHSWDALFSFLTKSGFSAADLEKAGLCLPRAEAEGYYDRFRNRLMFPIFDLSDRVIGFGGRVLAGEEVKYLNTPETPLFHKGRTLYGLNWARRAIGEAGQAVIVEGYFDVITCQESGFPQTVATLGTALTEEHLRVLRRYTSQVIIAFDADSAGLQATLRSRPLFAQTGLEVRVAQIPKGKDPDLLIREQGPEAFAQVLERTVGIVDYQLQAIASKYDLRNDEERLRLTREVVPILADLDPLAQAHYARQLAEQWCHPNLGRVALAEQAIHQELRRLAWNRRRAGREKTTQPTAIEDLPRPGSASVQAERELLAAMLQSSQAAEQMKARLSAEDFTDAIHKRIFRAISEIINQGKSPSSQQVLSQLAEEGPDLSGLVSRLALEEMEVSEKNLRDLVDRIDQGRMSARYRELEQRIRQGEELNRQELGEMVKLKRSISQTVGRKSHGSQP